jgi:D-amino-acid dehydrogenase
MVIGNSGTNGRLANRAPRCIAVIGAGVVGSATALTLAERGHHVLLLDKAAAPGLGTSFGNGAQLSYAYTDALASPALRRAIPRVLLGRDPAFRVRLRLDPDFLRWCLAFMANTAASAATANTIAGLRLAARSRVALAGLAQRHGLAFDHAKLGKLIVYRSERALDAARAAVALKAQHGAVQRLLTAEQTIALAPLLADTGKDIIGAVHDAGEETGDPHLFCREACGSLAAIGGCETRFGTTVAGLEPGLGRVAIRLSEGGTLDAEAVIVCGGPQTNHLTAPLGARLPIALIKGHSITAPPGPQPLGLSITDAARRIVVAPLGDHVRIAGLADLGARDARVEPPRLEQLIADAQAVVPAAADYAQIKAQWAGLRPVTPNSLPIIRRVAPGVIVNAGHGALGWTYAAGCAAAVADMIDERPQTANDHGGVDGA